ncbi:secreted protein [Streptomyces formicae]|uniref:Secreted protein n=2 Tax=Streptomyces formicae TaxID=1616117 RepID=A0A291QD17_9ACTN|nr:secreted protein [Streptomyces formicae]
MRVRPRVTTACLALAIAAGALMTGGTAHADEDFGNGKGSAKTDAGKDGGNGIYATAQVKYTGAVSKPGSPGNVTSSDVTWDPPPCWYAPYLGAKDFKKKMSGDLKEAMGKPGMTGHAGAALNETQRHYEDDYGWADTPGYKDYNVEKDGKGMFWAGVENPDEPDYLKRTSCTDLPFWVDNGEKPPPQYEEAITPEMLSKLAYQRMQLPDTKVSLAPDGTTKVNLPTWAWLDKAVFDDVKATATVDVPGFHIEATTTATPKSLTLKPGTGDATLIPASGECPIVDGKIGEPYAKGKSKETPPCGIVYGRSSGGETFPLKAALTWEISWTGTGQNAPQGMPDGTIEVTQDIAVEEVQSVNR